MNDPSGGQTAAPPGVSQTGWDRYNKINDRDNPNYFDDWSETFKTPGMSMRDDAEAVRNGTMSLEAYAAKYGTSISPANIANYIYPDAELLQQEGQPDFGYNVILNVLGDITHVSQFQWSQKEWNGVK
jgi:hypothetical protein